MNKRMLLTNLGNAIDELQSVSADHIEADKSHYDGAVQCANRAQNIANVLNCSRSARAELYHAVDHTRILRDVGRRRGAAPEYLETIERAESLLRLAHNDT